MSDYDKDFGETDDEERKEEQRRKYNHRKMWEDIEGFLDDIDLDDFHVIDAQMRDKREQEIASSPTLPREDGERVEATDQGPSGRQADWDSDNSEITCPTVHPYIDEVEAAIPNDLVSRSLRVSELQSQIAACLSNEVVANWDIPDTMSSDSLKELLERVIDSAFMHHDVISPHFGGDKVSNAYVTAYMVKMMKDALQFLTTNPATWPPNLRQRLAARMKRLLDLLDSGRMSKDDLDNIAKL